MLRKKTMPALMPDPDESARSSATANPQTARSAASRLRSDDARMRPSQERS